MKCVSKTFLAQLCQWQIPKEFGGIWYLLMSFSNSSVHVSLTRLRNSMNYIHLLRIVFDPVVFNSITTVL